LGYCLRGTKRDEWSGAGGGQAGVVTPHTKFKAEVYILSKERGSSHAVFHGLSAAVLFSHDGRDGVLHLPEGVEMVMPGDNVAITRS